MKEMFLFLILSNLVLKCIFLHVGYCVKPWNDCNFLQVFFLKEPRYVELGNGQEGEQGGTEVGR